MKKTTGTISFVGGIMSFIFLVYIFFDEVRYYSDIRELLMWLGFLILCICIIHYTLTTKFWTSRIPVIESLERENQIIRKQIEKKELLVKLQNLEAK